MVLGRTEKTKDFGMSCLIQREVKYTRKSKKVNQLSTIRKEGEQSDF